MGEMGIRKKISTKRGKKQSCRIKKRANKKSGPNLDGPKSELWDKTKTLAENYQALGLGLKLNDLGRGKKTKNEMIKTKIAQKAANPKTAVILFKINDLGTTRR